MEQANKIFEISTTALDISCRDIGKFIQKHYNNDENILLMGLMRGGLPILTWVSHASKINRCGVISLSMSDENGIYHSENIPDIKSVLFPEEKKYKIILVDEIFETGKSLNSAKLFLEKLGHEVLASFVIVSKDPSTKLLSDSNYSDEYKCYHNMSMSKETWITFPWEEK